jgi:hypothetical protein
MASKICCEKEAQQYIPAEGHIIVYNTKYELSVRKHPCSMSSPNYKNLNKPPKF